jgi:hypothetical protein
MNVRNWLTAVLLLFVGVTLVALVVQNVRERRSTAAALPLAEGTSVVYFHGKLDCSTCRTIEAYAREAVADGFAKPLQTGGMSWREIDFDEPQAAHFKQDFDLVATSLVLVEVRGGRPARWKMLPDVWSLTGDKTQFVQYVQGEVRRFQGHADIAGDKR